MKKEIGSRWIIKVPSSYLMSSASIRWQGVTVEIISKTEYRTKNPGPIIPASRVAIKIVKTPGESYYKSRIGQWGIVWRDWLHPVKDTEPMIRAPHLCTCATFVIWKDGCQCGGI